MIKFSSVYKESLMKIKQATMPEIPRMLAIASLLFLSVELGRAQQIGQVLPPWSPGTLDIHHINTGRGDSALLIFPDGTSLLVDAGDHSFPPPRESIPKPNASRTPGEWIARYVRHMLAQDTNPALDYALLTHFHGDHMGEPGPASGTARGGYKLSGITDFAEHLPIRMLIDRGWPDYDYPTPVQGNNIENYRLFLDWQMKESGLQVERLQPGRNDQIVLRRDPQRHLGFEVRNIATNGEIWTGVGTNTRHHFPRIQDLQSDDYPTENMCSLAIRVSYGKFDYFTGGDLPGVLQGGEPIWNDVETPVAQVVGPVEVAVLNHHGVWDAVNTVFLQALRPRVMVISVWTHPQPSWPVLDRIFSTHIYSGPRDVFATNILPSNRIVIGERLNRLKSSQGHIVVRVEAGGENFRVIILDDDKESFHVKAVWGPYQTR